jgi:DnaJ family protein C protein 7
MPVKEVNDVQFEQEIRNANKLVVVDMFAVWCGPCKTVAPVFEQLSIKYVKVATFLKVDVDKCTMTKQKYNINAMPTFLLIKNGKKIAEVVGADMPKLEEEIKKHADKPAEPIPSYNTANEYKDAGNKSFSAGDWKTAAELYTKAIALDSTSASYYSNRSACYLQMKNYKDALKDALKCVELDPKFVKGYFRAGTAYTCLGQLDQAASQLQLALKIEPNNQQVKNELVKIERIKNYVSNGQKALDSKNYQQALSQFESALELAPMSTRIKLYKLEAELYLGKTDDVVKEAGLILRDEDPNNAEAYFLRGKAIYYNGNIDNGLRNVNQALQLDPDNAKYMKFRKILKKSESLKEEGNVFFKGSKYQEALDKYNEAIENDPINKSLNAQLYCNMSACQSKLGNWEEAISSATKAIELNPQYLKAYVRRAQCYQQVGKHEEAKRDYHKATEIDPESTELKKKLKEAEKLYKKSKRKDYYKLLDVPKDADTETIKKAYKKAALKFHPDRFVDEQEKKVAEEKFKDISEAHDVLTNPEKRRRYDSGVDMEDLDGPGGFGFENGDIGDIFRMFMSGGMGGFPGGGVRFSTSGGRGGMGGMGGFPGFF